jgi:hypothetical protein
MDWQQEAEENRANIRAVFDLIIVDLTQIAWNCTDPKEEWIFLKAQMILQERRIQMFGGRLIGCLTGKPMIVEHSRTLDDVKEHATWYEFETEEEAISWSEAINQNPDDDALRKQAKVLQREHIQ